MSLNLQRNCNLECTKDNVGDEAFEFVGPVKIIMVEQTRREYFNKTWSAAALLLAEILIGITTIMVFFFSTTFKKNEYLKGLHIFLGTVGLQLCVPFGMLSLNTYNGPAIPMKLEDRKFEHKILQIFGCICTTCATLAAIAHTKIKTKSVNILIDADVQTIHFFLGLAANGFLIFNGLMGMFVYGCFKIANLEENLGWFGRSVLSIHRLLGLLSWITSSACFVSGILRECYRQWLPMIDIFYFHIGICIIYTIIILMLSIKHYTNS